MGDERESPQLQQQSGEPSEMATGPVTTHGKLDETGLPTTAVPAARRTGNMTTDAERTRARQSLELQRERILSERTSSPHRRSALASALASVEEQLSELGWMLHL